MAGNYETRRSTPDDDPAPAADAGCWFLVPESEIRRLGGHRRGSPFSAKPGRRPVVLSEPIAGDDTVLFPRSTQPGYWRGAREFHRRHDHSRTNERCRLTQDGWVILDMAVTVVRQHLNASTFSCREPEDTGLLETIDRQLPR